MKLSDNGFPRRARVDLWTSAERAIQDAVWEVEKAGCHQFLTEAVCLLAQARDKVADFVERGPDGPVYDGSYASVKAVERWGGARLGMRTDGSLPPDALSLNLFDERGQYAGGVVCRPGDRLSWGPDGGVVVESTR